MKYILAFILAFFVGFGTRRLLEITGIIPEDK